MRRCGSGFLLTLAIILVLTLTGCLGKSTTNPPNGGVASVTLSPTNYVSLNIGGTQVFSASARDASGRTVVGAEIQFLVVSGTPNAPAPLSIASNGNACAGSWDQSVAICSPGNSGIAYVTAVTSGVSSPVTTVYVHQHVDSIQVASAETQNQQYDCFSQGQTWQFKGIAYSNNVDITDTVGPFNWSFSTNGVATVVPIVAGTQANPVYLEEATAKAPGITQLFASVSGTTSAPYSYTTCLIKEIHLQIGGQAQAGSSITVNNGGNVPITATALDSLYNVIDFSPLPAPPLTWSTTNPEIIAFSTTTNSTSINSASARANLGGATITASCSPPSCNIGVFPGMPVYASNGTLPNGTTGYGAISVDVTTTTKPPTYTAWAATNECADAPGCSSALFSLTATTGSTNPIGAIVSLPRTPNSMMFNHLSSARVYLGSDQGLMFVDVTSASPAVSLISSATTPCNVSLCGKILTISNDGKSVVVADNISTPNQVYIYNGSGTPIDLIIPGETATAAAFSPDQLKLFILTSTGKMYVYSTVDALNSVPVANSVTDLAFSADGSFAYVAGDPNASISEYSACGLNGSAAVKLGNSPTAAAPLKIFPSPNVLTNGPPLSTAGANSTQPSIVQNVLALEPPNLEILKAEFTQVPLSVTPPLPGKSQLSCNPPAVSSPPLTSVASYNLGLPANATVIDAQLVADGTELIVLAQNIPAVIVFNVGNGTTTSVPLTRQGFGSSYPIAASASTDGSQVFVAACDEYAPDGVTCSVGSIHIVNTITQGDIQQVPYVNVNDNNDTNMCNNGGNPVPQCLPNMIAIRPQ